MKRTWELENPEATQRAGHELAATLEAGDVLALVGDLGAGKTQLCQAIVAGLDATETVTSPTFTLVQEYPSGRLPVWHFDFYRLESADELLGLGWDDYLNGDGVLLVEWADRHPEMLPPEAQWWRLEILGENRRRLTRIEAP